MGSSISRAAYTSFELLNELAIAIGSGIVGLSVLMVHGITTYHICRTAFITSITVGSLIYIFSASEKYTPSKRKVVFISGCDSGLGFSLACHAHEKGFTVVAACLNLDSKGANELQSKYGDEILQIELDVTQSLSIKSAVDVVQNFLNTDQKYGEYILQKISLEN